MLPAFPLVNVREAEFPVLVRLINAFEESLPLLVLRQVQEELDDPGAVAMQVLLQIRDGPIWLFPNAFLVEQLPWQPLTAENFWMHPDDQHFLIIGTIEDADPPAFRQMTVRAPEKIMFQLVGGRLGISSPMAISLRNAKTKYFHVKALSNGCFYLEPRVLVSPQAISARSLKMLDKSVANLRKGLASAPIDLSAFAEA
jgi:hypothetical protein